MHELTTMQVPTADGIAEYKVRRLTWEDALKFAVLRVSFGIESPTVEATREDLDNDLPEEDQARLEEAITNQIDNASLAEALICSCCAAPEVTPEELKGWDPLEVVMLYGQLYKFNGLDKMVERANRFRELLTPDDDAGENQQVDGNDS